MKQFGREFFVLISAAGMMFPQLAASITITTNTNALNLVNNILGPGVTLVGAPTFTGGATQAGTFVDGASTVGFNSGIVLHSGDVQQIPGPNNNAALPETRSSGALNGEDVSVDTLTAGDPDLSGLAGFPTFNASVLEFDFQFEDGSVGGDINFNYVFASEEYVNFIDTEFNDVFAFFIDGVNIGTINGDPVTVNTLNDVANSSLYVNNVDNTDGIPNANLDFSFDGKSVVLTATALGLSPGAHSVKLAVADTSDGILDAGVFIQQGTFNPDVTPAVPIPAAIWLFGSGLLGIIGIARRKKAA